MNQNLIYTFIGMVGYFVAYLVIGCGMTAIWKAWAHGKAGVFWEYSMNEGLRIYYPGVWWFVRECHKLYTVIYILLWPIMVPGQLIMMTKVMRRLMYRRYWY